MKNVKSILRILGHINYILSSKQKRASIIVFVSMIVCSLLELLGVSVIYPFLLLMTNENGMRDKWYLKWIYRAWPQISNIDMIIVLGITVAFIYVLKNALAIFCTYEQLDYSTRINKELSVKMLKSYMMRPYEYFVNTHSKIIMRGLNGDVASVFGIILDGFQILAELLTIVAIVVYLIKIDVFIAVVSMASGGICFVAVTLGFKGLMKKLGSESRGLAAEGPGYTYQLINGIKEITVLDRRESFIETYEAFQKKGAEITRKTQVVAAMPNRIMEATCVVAVMLVLCARISSGVNMQTFLPTLGSFVMGVFRIMPSMSKLSTRINNIVYLLPGLDNTYVIMKEAERIEREYEEEEKILKRQLDEYGYDKLKFNNEIIVKDVHWKYENGHDEVLKGLNLVIKKGESVGLIGSSGGGKSTIIDILMSLFKPQQGCVLMDGVDVFLMKYRWRSMIGYVPQSIFLTGGSIRENVAFGLTTEQVNEEKIWSALEQAQLKHFVETLPDKLDTIVGERGVKLSGGQRQRIAIARALYNEPEILILDEATAALDNETERDFMDAIDSLRGKKTIILVAHRLTTVKNCNKVYEISNGIAIERSVQEVIASSN